MGGSTPDGLGVLRPLRRLAARPRQGGIRPPATRPAAEHDDALRDRRAELGAGPRRRRRQVPRRRTSSSSRRRRRSRAAARHGTRGSAGRSATGSHRCSAMRTATLALPEPAGRHVVCALPPLTDSAGHVGSALVGETLTARLYAERQPARRRVGPAACSTVVRWTRARRAYKLEYSLSRDSDGWKRSTTVHTIWGFTSATPTGDYDVLPLLGVRYGMTCRRRTPRLAAGRSPSASSSRCPRRRVAAGVHAERPDLLGRRSHLGQGDSLELHPSGRAATAARRRRAP